MKCKCSNCNNKVEIPDSTFLFLFNRNEKIECKKCYTKEHCYDCTFFLRNHWYDDYCSYLKKDQFIMNCPYKIKINNKERINDNRDGIFAKCFIITQ